MKHGQNIKYKILNIKNAVQKSKIFEFLFVVLILVFIFLNFVFSQFVSPLYFHLVDNDKNAVISFLQKIKSLPEYQNILEMNNSIYGNSIKDEVFRLKNEKKTLINNLEQQLIINPKSRDVLYSLYQLYLAEGDKNRANGYLRQARAIDPSIR